MKAKELIKVLKICLDAEVYVDLASDKYKVIGVTQKSHYMKDHYFLLEVEENGKVKERNNVEKERGRGND